LSYNIPVALCVALVERRRGGRRRRKVFKVHI
jgi:hypothetical protein